MNAPPQPPQVNRLVLYVVLLVVLFLDDFLLWILGDSRIQLAETIVGATIVVIAVGMFFIREPGIRRNAWWLFLCWLGIAALHFGKALGIPKSELRPPLLLGLGLLGTAALGYWLLRGRRESHPLQ